MEIHEFDPALLNRKKVLLVGGMTFPNRTNVLLHLLACGTSGLGVAFSSDSRSYEKLGCVLGPAYTYWRWIPAAVDRILDRERKLATLYRDSTPRGQPVVVAIDDVVHGSDWASDSLTDLYRSSVTVLHTLDYVGDMVPQIPNVLLKKWTL